MREPTPRPVIWLPQRRCGTCCQKPHKKDKQNYKERIPITGKAKVRRSPASEMAEQLKALPTSGTSLTLHPQHHKVVLWPPWRCPGLCFPPCLSINQSSFLGQAEQLSRAHLLSRLKTWVPHLGLTWWKDRNDSKSCPLTSHKTDKLCVRFSVTRQFILLPHQLARERDQALRPSPGEAKPGHSGWCGISVALIEQNQKSYVKTHACPPSTWNTEAGDQPWVRGSLGNTVNSTSAWAIIWDPTSKN